MTGYEFHIINMVSFCCPQKLILPYLRETLEEIKSRELDPKPWYRCRVGIVGSEVDDPNLTRMLEDAGAFIAFDRFCFGVFPGREVIELNDEEPALVQICRHYLITSECPRFMSDEKIFQRRETADRLAREFKADGIIYENVKFCDFWASSAPSPAISSMRTTATRSSPSTGPTTPRHPASSVPVSRPSWNPWR